MPAYYSTGGLLQLAEDIEKEPILAKKHDILEHALKGMYNPSVLAVMLLERYCKLAYVKEFNNVIADAIEAFHLGLVNVAVASLIPVIEGTLRRIAEKYGEPVSRRNPHKKILSTIDILIEEEKSSPIDIRDERVMMLTSFRTLVDNYLFIDTDKYSGIGWLNRHGILHGIYDPQEYAKDYNFYKLISVIDTICFFVTLHSSGISALAPPETLESKSLAAYYMTLIYLKQNRTVFFDKSKIAHRVKKD